MGKADQHGGLDHRFGPIPGRFLGFGPGLRGDCLEDAENVTGACRCCGRRALTVAATQPIWVGSGAEAKTVTKPDIYRLLNMFGDAFEQVAPTMSSGRTTASRWKPPSMACSPISKIPIPFDPATAGSRRCLDWPALF